MVSQHDRLKVLSPAFAITFQFRLQRLGSTFQSALSPQQLLCIIIWRKKKSSISWTQLPHSEIGSFQFLFEGVYVSKRQSHIDLNWTSKGCGGRYFSRHSIFHHWKHCVQIKDWHSYQHGPSSIQGKPLSAFIFNLKMLNN